MARHFIAAFFTVAIAAALALVGYLVLFVLAAGRGETAGSPLNFVLLPVFAGMAVAIVTLLLVGPLAAAASWLCARHHLNAVIPPVLVFAVAAAGFVFAALPLREGGMAAVRSLPIPYVFIGVLTLIGGPAFVIYWTVLLYGDRRANAAS